MASLADSFDFYLKVNPWQVFRKYLPTTKLWTPDSVPEKKPPSWKQLSSRSRVLQLCACSITLYGHGTASTTGIWLHSIYLYLCAGEGS